jgi:hypothetical protein
MCRWYTYRFKRARTHACMRISWLRAPALFAATPGCGVVPPQVCVWCAAKNEVMVPADRLREHRIDGMMLLQLDDEMLVELGVQKKVHRVRAVQSIAAAAAAQQLKLVGNAPSGIKVYVRT